MQVSPKALAEFKEIYRERFCRELTDQEACDSASGLLRLMNVVYRPITKKNMEEVMIRRADLGILKGTNATTEDPGK